MANFYKPIYKQQPPKYTNGGQFVIQSSLKEYIGFYIQNSDGNYYTYPDFNNSVSEILLQSPTPLKTDSNTIQYYQMTRADYSKKIYPIYYIPTVTQYDIQRGYLIRYVAQKINEPNVIIEISKEQFIPNTNLAISKNVPGIDTNIWIMHNINWTINGVYADVIKNNRKVLNAAERYVPGISKYFTDLAEYIQVPMTGPDRIYTDGDAVPMSLPTSYQIRTSNQVPLGQACANCIFRFGNNCRKWEAEVRNNHWCRAWQLGNQ